MTDAPQEVELGTQNECEEGFSLSIFAISLTYVGYNTDDGGRGKRKHLQAAPIHQERKTNHHTQPHHHFTTERFYTIAI